MGGGIKDSGERREFSTGAVRDMSSGKGRFDLLPHYGVEAVAIVMEDGANKYGERNWEQGINVSSFCDSATRHLNKFMRGESDEPHLAQAAWNILCALDTRRRIQLGKLPRELDNIGVSVSDGTPSGWTQPKAHAVAPQEIVSHAHCSDYKQDGSCERTPCKDCDLNEGSV